MNISYLLSLWSLKLVASTCYYFCYRSSRWYSSRDHSIRGSMNWFTILYDALKWWELNFFVVWVNSIILYAIWQKSGLQTVMKEQISSPCRSFSRAMVRRSWALALWPITLRRLSVIRHLTPWGLMRWTGCAVLWSRCTKTRIEPADAYNFARLIVTYMN